MTPSDYSGVHKRCRQFWGTTLRGGLGDESFPDFVQAVCMALLEDDGQIIGNVCRSVLRDMRREADKQADIRAHVAFEGQHEGDRLPMHFEVPFHKGWGGPRPNSGGARHGAGRPRRDAA